MGSGMPADSTDPRFPIGEFVFAGELDESEREAAIDAIEATPAELRLAVAGLNESELDTPYREGGWTVRQVVHHLPDSHMNSLIRFKLGLTEDTPTVRTYREELFAELADARTEVEGSIRLLEALHERWVLLLRGLEPGDWRRAIRHPDFGLMRLDHLLAFYAWHGRHHVAHILSLRERQGW